MKRNCRHTFKSWWLKCTKILIGYEKIRVPDLGKQKDFFLEVNWNKDPKIQNCAVARVTFPNGETMHVNRDHLHAIFFALGTPEQQQKLIPQTLHPMRQLEGYLPFTPTKDIKKGEKILIPFKLSVPEPEQMVLQDLKKKVQKQGIESIYR